MKRGIENLLYQLISSYCIWDIEAHWNLMLMLYRIKPGGFGICISTADFWLLRRIVRKNSYFCLWGVKFRKTARLSMGDSCPCTACEVLPVLGILKESDMRQWYLIEFSLWYPTLSQVGSGPQNLPWLYQEIKSGKWSWTMPEILVLSSRIMMFSLILSAFQNLGPQWSPQCHAYPSQNIQTIRIDLEIPLLLVLRISSIFCALRNNYEACLSCSWYLGTLPLSDYRSLRRAEGFDDSNGGCSSWVRL